MSTVGTAPAPTRSPSGPAGATGRLRTRLPSAVLAVMLAVALAVGTFLRIWMVGHDSVNSDESVVGLQARLILHGHFVAFFWGQHYGGVEPYVVAALFGVFGQSPLVLGLSASLLSLGTSVVIWRIGRHLFPPAAALTAGVLAWIWPEVMLWISTYEYGFRQVAVLLGLLTMLFSVRIADGAGAGRPIDWALLGLSAGLGVWASPEMVYFVLPVLWILVAGLRRRVSWALAPRGVLCLTFAAIGALPWIVVSVQTHFATLHSTTSPVSHNSYGERLSVFFTHTLPLVLGVRVEGAGVWEGSDAVAGAALALIVAALLAALVVLTVRVPAARGLVVFCVSFPFLFAASTNTWFWNDGRYVMFLAPVLSLVLCGALWTAVGESTARAVAAGVLVAALVSTLVAFNVGYGTLTRPSRLTDFSTNPNAAVGTLAQGLERAGVHDVYAGYWVSYDVQFLSGGRITAMALQNDRTPAFDGQVERARRAGWVFVYPPRLDDLVNGIGTDTFLQSGTITEPAFETWLTAHHIAWHLDRIGDFDVIVPSRNVTPAELPP